MLEHPSQYDGMNEIWDLRDASLAPNAAGEINAFIDFVTPHMDKLAKRAAYVVGKDLDYGIMRMWMAYADGNLSQKQQLFKNMDDAIGWLLSEL